MNEKKLDTLAARLRDAADAVKPKVSRSDLARACGVSPAAVTKWFNGLSTKMTAENYAAAAKKLRVNDLWLRTGKGPRARDSTDESQVDEVLEILNELRGPVALLATAMERLSMLRIDSRKVPK